MKILWISKDEFGFVFTDSQRVVESTALFVAAAFEGHRHVLNLIGISWAQIWAQWSSIHLCQFTLGTYKDARRESYRAICDRDWFTSVLVMGIPGWAMHFTFTSTKLCHPAAWPNGQCIRSLLYSSDFSPLLPDRNDHNKHASAPKAIFTIHNEYFYVEHIVLSGCLPNVTFQL